MAGAAFRESTLLGDVVELQLPTPMTIFSPGSSTTPYFPSFIYHRSVHKVLLSPGSPPSPTSTMSAPRAAFRSSRVLLRTQTPRSLSRQQFRCASSDAAAAGGSSGALTGGLIGATAALAIGYGFYHFSGARSTVNSITSTKQYFEDTFKKTTENAPEPNQAIQWLKSQAGAYAAFVPGAKKYVDRTFDELESIQKKHGKEVDAIAKDTYSQLKDVSKSEGASIEGVMKSWSVIQEAAKKIGDLAGDVGQDLLNKNPELKEKYGDKLNEFKKMGEQYGPEAKKQVDETMNKVQDIVKGGIGVGSIAEIKKLVESKVEEVRKYGDQAWEKGLEQAKPYLDKSPQVKEFVEKNKDKLKNANLNELWTQVKEAAQSGDTKNLEKFVKDKAGEAQKQFGGKGLEEYFKMIPGGEDVGGKFKQLQELGEKHGKKAEDLLKEAFEEIKKVLEKKVDQGQKLADDAKKDAK